MAKWQASLHLDIHVCVQESTQLDWNHCIKQTYTLAMGVTFLGSNFVLKITEWFSSSLYLAMFGAVKWYRT
jgi:hypothetical protein